MNEGAAPYYNMGYTYLYKQEEINCLRKAAQLGQKDAKEWLRKNGYSW